MTVAQNALASLAFGRILRMASRPSVAGDVEEYERCRKIIMDAAGDTGDFATLDKMPLPGWNFGSGATGCIE